MPKDLPGLYWDEEKKRYFPLASRPAGPPQTSTSQTAAVSHSQSHRNPTGSRRQRSPSTKSKDSDSPPPKRQHSWDEQAPRQDYWRALNALRESSLSVQRRRCMRSLPDGCCSDMQATCLAESMSKIDDIPIRFDGAVMALCAKINENERRLLVGDNTGWLYSVDTDDPDPAIREFGLRSQITSITRSGPVCMVTSLGSPSRMFVTRDDSIGLWVLREIPPHVCSDVWCGQVWDRRATIGGGKATVSWPDVERDDFVKLNRNSDVLSVCMQHENVTYAGMRNGIIDRWDSRSSGSKTDVVVNMSEGGQGGRGVASVDHIRIVHEYEMLVRTMRGDLESHDLRFLRKNDPILRFEGHIPSYESKLGIAVDPNENFVFAGGGDCRLRIWSLSTGQCLPSRNENFLSVTLEGNVAKPSQPIRAMEILEDSSRAWLWVAYNSVLNRIDLGPRGLLY
ncbi:hypothetical protein C8Q74DRAFT_1201519 [Fomes fomentarius]|nr:hypothetical protein C8Q74DRAFT_1201519 [Fomes fomentarius]